MKLNKIKNIKFGIIGLGSIGKIHKKNIEKLGYKTLVFDPFLDISKKKQNEKISKINKTCSAVIISSPSNTHFKYLDYFVKRKKHIFIEKPFTHEIKKTKKIIQRAKKDKIIIALNYNLRIRSSIILLKKILKKIVKIYWSNFIMSSNVLDWRKKYNFKLNYTHKKVAGGIIFDSIHEIDLNQFLFKNIKVINFFKSNLKRNIFKNSTYANINLLINKKFSSNIQLDYHGNPDQRKIEILTDKGLIKVNIKKNFLKILNKKNKIEFYKKFDSKKNEDYKKMINNFISCIKDNSIKPVCSAEEGLKNIQIAIKANEK